MTKALFASAPRDENIYNYKVLIQIPNKGNLTVHAVESAEKLWLIPLFLMAL